MITFESDYTNGACPEILERFAATNQEQQVGYLQDDYCKSACRRIAEACGHPEAADSIYLTVGGTQANALVIGSCLKDFQGVVAAKTGHISLHEGGAIEFTGHKVLELGHTLGKVNADELRSYLEGFYADDNRDKMVHPAMLYISFPTEYGTVYSKAEIAELSEICHRYDMQLFIDGARMGYGLAASDVSLQDIFELSDVFYIGGTKVGAFCGEAIVFTKQNMPEHFEITAKQRGALIAKGRLLGVQFDTLFTDGLYLKIGKHAVDAAMRIREIFTSNGYEMFIDSPTNQQFVILENGKMEELKKKVGFCFWEKYDEHHTVVRFASSWSTTDAELEYLANVIAG